jgi:hypothetical protein
MSLVKRVHQDPQEWIVYLNPKRTEQVLIYDEATWLVLPLVEAIRSLFDRVARGILKATSLSGKERQKLPPEVAESAPWLSHMYGERREYHIVQAKPSMAAHLENMVPGRATLAPPGSQNAPHLLQKVAAAPHEKAKKALEERPEPAKKVLEERPEQAKKAPEERPEQAKKVLEERPEQAKKTPEERPEQAKKALEERPEPAKGSQGTEAPRRPAPYTMYDAAALMRAVKIKKGEGWADSAKRLEAGSKGQEAGRIMSKLWEAMEEGLLSEAEGMAVRELVTEYDAATIMRK